MLIFKVLILAALSACVVLAWRYGGRQERLTAGAFVLATLASNLVDQARYSHTETGIMMVDLALLAGLVVLALRSDRFWPMWAAAFQLVATMVHVASMTETGEFAAAYAVGLIFWTYPVIAALIAGTMLEARFRNR